MNIIVFMPRTTNCQRFIAFPSGKQARGSQVADNSTTSEQAGDAENRITLDLLNAVHENAQASQRSLASDLGIALGLTNAYLKRCVRKGLVKVAQAPANRYAYYLTPKGFSEKSRLTAGYLKRSFDFYRHARSECDDALANCAAHNWNRVVLVGTGDLAEIALLCALQHGVTIVGVLDAHSMGTTFIHVPLAQKIDALGSIDAALITDVSKPQRAYLSLGDALPTDRIIVPPLLGFAPDTAYSDAGDTASEGLS
jgi:DNA-binding MarR family transcriptional regulator